MLLLLLLALLVLLAFVVVSGTVLVPLLLPIVLFTPSGPPQVLSGDTAVIGPVVPMMAPQPLQRLGGRPSQFALGLNPVDAYAACGPTAAIAFGRWWGREIPASQVMSIAAAGLWDANNGMHGVASEQALLGKLALPSRLEVPVDWRDVVVEASNGRPVILDTPGHYYFVDGYNASTGTLHVGTSGTDLRGGSDWMTPAQINGQPVSQGVVRSAIYASTAPPPVLSGGVS